MCADGPADVLDFDDEEFMGGLSIHNRIMYRRKTKNLLRPKVGLPITPRPPSRPSLLP